MNRLRRDRKRKCLKKRNKKYLGTNSTGRLFYCLIMNENTNLIQHCARKLIKLYDLVNKNREKLVTYENSVMNYFGFFC